LLRLIKKYEIIPIDAIKTYERVAEKGYKSADMFQKLVMHITSMQSLNNPLNGMNYLP
jgi:hypothetical protein